VGVAGLPPTVPAAAAAVPDGAAAVPSGTPAAVPDGAVTTAGAAGGTAVAPRRGRRGRARRWTDDELDGDPVALLTPYAEAVADHAAAHRFEEAAQVRDEAERLRSRIERRRRIRSLVEAGRVVLEVPVDGTVVVDGGLLVGDQDGLFAPDGDDGERAIVGGWLAAHAAGVRVVAADGPVGLAVPAVRIPDLSELVAAALAALTARAVTAAHSATAAPAEAAGAVLAATADAAVMSTPADIAPEPRRPVSSAPPPRTPGRPPRG
jgi:hypothetical protein